MSIVVRIPQRFYDEHCDVGDLPAPPVEHATKAHYWIDLDHADAEELIDDAAFYVDPLGPDQTPPGIVSGARALLNAIRRQAPEHPKCPQ